MILGITMAPEKKKSSKPLTKNHLNNNLVTLKNGTNLVLTAEHASMVRKRETKEKKHYRLERLDNPLVLTKCKLPLRPCNNVVAAGFPQYIFENLSKMQISETFRIQSYSWPAILTNDSLIVINAPKTGKTIGYLPSICSYALLDDIQAKNRWLSPIVLILAPTASEVDDIYNFICRIDVQKRLQTTRVHQWFNKPVALSNGWDIIIATPLVYSKLLAYNSVTTLKAVDIVVLDNVELDCQYVQQILNSCDARIKAQQAQLIVISENFNNYHDMVLNRYDANILIGAHLESAIYGGVQFVFKVLYKSKKKVAIENILSDLDYRKMLVICKNKDEVISVSDHLSLLSVTCLKAHEDTEHLDLERVYKVWHRERSDMILVCTDHTFPDLDITDATTIIHYSLPLTWTGFTHRYSCMINNLSRTSNKPKCYSFHLLDEDTVRQLPRIISFVERLGQPVDENLKSVVEQEMEKQEYEKALSGIDLCGSMLLLGHCDKINSCINRHKMTLYDAPREHLPTSGELKYRILKILGVDYYMALLLSFRKPGKREWEDFESETLNSAMCSLYYNNLPDTAVISAQAKIGHICAVSMGGGVYERCEIKQVNESVRKMAPTTVNIELIDRGIKIDKINVNTLLELPDHLKKPSFIVAIRLGNIKPHDDNKWCDMANISVKNILNLPLSDEEYFTSKILFVLQNHIWVNDICKGHVLSGVEVCTQSLRRQILDKDIGVPNNSQVERLLTLYNDTKKNVKNEEKNNNQDTKEASEETLQEIKTETIASDKIAQKINILETVVKQNDISPSKSSVLERFMRWARQKADESVKQQIIPDEINLGIGNTYEGYLTVAYDDEDVTFYIQLNANIDPFNKLNSDIEEFTKTTDNLRHFENAQIGNYCLVKCENNIFNRAKILKLPNDAKDEEKDENNAQGYVVYLIDYGDTETVQEVFVIENDLLKLPQQAVKCKLHDLVIDVTVIEDIVAMLYEHSGTIWFVSVIDILEDKTYSVKVEKAVNEKIVCLNETAARFCEKAEKLFQICSAPKKDMSLVWNILAGLDEDSDCPEKIFEDLNELMTLYGTQVEDNPTPKIIEINDESTSEEIPKIDHSKNISFPPAAPSNLTPVHNIPNVIWSQDEIEIMLKFQTPDVDKYTLRVTMRHIYFKTVAGNGITYEFAVKLFGPVVPVLTKHKALGPYVYVVCAKLVSRYWTNLYLGDHKLKFITHDHDWKVMEFSKKDNKSNKLIDYDDVDEIDLEDNDEGDSDEIDLESDDNEILDMMD